MMRAIVKRQAKIGLELQEVPQPSIGEQDLLIKVRKTSICGTDVHIYKWDEWAQKTLKLPLIIGHEFVGEIVDKGSQVKGFSIGERVTGEGHITCGQCRNCLRGLRHLCPATIGLGVNRDGCFADYLAIPSQNAFKLPASISDDLASIFDPFGNAVHTALSFDLVGEDVLICGAGPIGLMAVAIARHVGARHIVITDLNDYRLKIAKQLGATKAINVQKQPLEAVLKELQIPDGFDVVMEMSGSPEALQQGISLATPGAKIGLLGLLPNHAAIDWHQVIFKGLFLKGIYGREIFGTWQKMTRLIESGLNISPVITHHLPCERYEEGFAGMMEGKVCKVVLDW